MVQNSNTCLFQNELELVQGLKYQCISAKNCLLNWYTLNLKKDCLAQA